ARRRGHLAPYQRVTSARRTNRGDLPVTQAYPPADLAATLFRQAGIGPDQEFHDAQSRPYRISQGKLSRARIRSALEHEQQVGGAMLSILDKTTHPADRVSRREWLRIGGLGALGVSLADVLRAAAPPAAQPGSAPRLAGDLGGAFGKAKNVLFL